MSDNFIKHPDVVWVVFTGKTDLKFLQVFKKQFRHCFVVMHSPTGWLIFDPLYLNTDISFYEDPYHEVFMPKWFDENGCSVVKTEVQNPPFKINIPSFYTCVEATKKIIGVNNFFIFTPFQLYKFLKKKGS